MPKKSKYNLVCIGDCTTDCFVTLKVASVRAGVDAEHPQLCMPFADKIPYESIAIVPGVGNAANVAVGASRLGLRTALLSAVGGDHYGKEILEVFRKEGVATKFVKVNKKKLTNYHFVLNFKAERTILIKHNDYDYAAPADLDRSADWLYFSSIGEHTLPFHKKVADFVKKHPGVKMGFNPGTFQLAFGAEKLKEIYRMTHVLFVNREEAELVTRSKNENIAPLFEKLHKLGPKIVVITDGPKGAYASDGESRFFMPPYPDPVPPLSRTGAGDAFSTGFLCALIYGLPIDEALRWAPIQSMHVVQYFGAQTGLLKKQALLSLLKKAPKNYKPKLI